MFPGGERGGEREEAELEDRERREVKTERKSENVKKEGKV